MKSDQLPFLSGDAQPQSPVPESVLYTDLFRSKCQGVCYSPDELRVAQVAGGVRGGPRGFLQQIQAYQRLVDHSCLASMLQIKALLLGLGQLYLLRLLECAVR